MVVMLDRYVHSLRVCEHFVSELVFNVFINIKPVKRTTDWGDLRRFSVFNHGTCERVLKLVKTVYIET